MLLFVSDDCSPILSLSLSFSLSPRSIIHTLLALSLPLPSFHHFFPHSSIALPFFRSITLFSLLYLSFLALSHSLSLALYFLAHFLHFSLCLSLSLSLSPLSIFLFIHSSPSPRSLSLCLSLALSPSLSIAPSSISLPSFIYLSSL